MQIGIIAGTGELPEIIARDAKERGCKVITIALENLASSALNDLSDEILWINVGKLGRPDRCLKKFRRQRSHYGREGPQVTPL